MRKRTSWILVALLFMTVLAFQAEPSRAAFPERYSLIMLDYFGFLMDCLDIGRCDAVTCPATLYLSGKTGSCMPMDYFSPGKVRTTCTFNRFFFSFFAPNTRRVELDLTCSWYGTPWFWEGDAGQPTGTCAVMATQFRIDQYGANFTKNESYTTATINRPQNCAAVFEVMEEEDIRDFDARDLVERQPK